MSFVGYAYTNIIISVLYFYFHNFFYIYVPNFVHPRYTSQSPQKILFSSQQFLIFIIGMTEDSTCH
jgi:hypothetical protein